MTKSREPAMKAARIEVFTRNDETFHKVICPYCRRVLIHPLKSLQYPKGYTMRCKDCKRVFKKFKRELRAG